MTVRRLLILLVDFVVVTFVLPLGLVSVMLSTMPLSAVVVCLVLIAVAAVLSQFIAYQLFRRAAPVTRRVA